MALHTKNNEYQGVNAHLHSYLQNEDGGWESFHAEHLVDLARQVNLQLPAGYYTRTEKSLQIREIYPDSSSIINPRPDVTIYQTESNAPAPASTAEITAPTAVLSVYETIETEEEFLNAFVVYLASEDQQPGKPVTRFELLSPTNKPPGRGYLQYLAKRRETLQGGLSLVEIDYLHQTRRIIRSLPVFPYMILVSNPHPSLAEGQSQFYGFHVDDPFPIVPIPLAEDDSLTLDFGAAYKETFKHSTFYPLVVDYEQLPQRFETYTTFDQERIKARMAAVKKP